MSSDSTITFALVPKGSHFRSPPLDYGQPAVEEIVEDPVVLMIPNSRLRALCLHPVKYLKFCDEPGHDVDDPIATLRDMDDKTNGFLCNPHGLYDDGSWAITHTPNHILTVEDIPKSDRRALFPPQTLSDPSRAGYQRFTAQWLINPSDAHLFGMGDNTDAAFANHSIQKLSAFLLDCTYGAAALRQWGVGDDSALRILPGHLPKPLPVDRSSAYTDEPVIEEPDKFSEMCSVLTGLYNAGLGKRVEPPGANVARWLQRDGAGI
ncbi:uncharacterized protein STEHIDRAFT_106490 [Stereum hirsutum FP-91666 SS1]|uniref:uncharacterized protein n=1 Tax=Stereum hirsutum (strain FP-91666) TaxID=721885 RepID=UPI000440D6AC|nr:uncharacterized protein STEHIDRAFT_106490 [Stereum hirsutum FP-91666 SS1]EIM91776.1 hypothetical protein STEHIDRAFT_106490 [Stereum hirsutum FP-91666 SS1]